MPRSCVIALGALELTGLQRWEQGGEIACGLWLIVSPFILGYAEADALRYWHFVLGALVGELLAVVERWRDWNLRDKELDQARWMAIGARYFPANGIAGPAGEGRTPKICGHGDPCVSANSGSIS